MFFRSIHGDVIASVSIVLHVEAENPGAMAMLWESAGGVDDDTSVVLLVDVSWPVVVDVSKIASAGVDEVATDLLVLVGAPYILSVHFQKLGIVGCKHA